jgi:hypothetical protein
MADIDIDKVKERVCEVLYGLSGDILAFAFQKGKFLEAGV